MSSKPDTSASLERMKAGMHLIKLIFENAEKKGKVRHYTVKVVDGIPVEKIEI